MILAVLGAALISCGKPGDDAPHPAIPSRYSPGGEYSFAGRSVDPGARFIVLHVDSHPKDGNIVHVAIHGIKIKNPQAPTGFAENVQHLPIAEAALEKSGPKLIRAGAPVPEFKEAYQLWRKPFDQGKAGIWTMPLAECLEAMEQSLNNRK
jgi:hypothetical protein